MKKHPEEKEGKEQEEKEAAKEKPSEEKNYLEDLQRVQAEFENYMKRVEKERGLVGEFAKKDLLLKLLVIVDEFEAGLNIMAKVENKEEMLKGVEMIFNKMNKMLEEENVRAIKSVGESFSPYLHDAIAKTSGEEDVVIEEVKKGYMFKDKLLRPSIVKVGNGGKNE